MLLCVWLTLAITHTIKWYKTHRMLLLSIRKEHMLKVQKHNARAFCLKANFAFLTLTKYSKCWEDAASCKKKKDI